MRRFANGVTPFGFDEEKVAVSVVPFGTAVNGKASRPPNPSADGSVTPETPLTGCASGCVVVTENAGTGGNVGAAVPVLKGGSVEFPFWHATSVTTAANTSTGTRARRLT